jgi:hypothetical protein
MTKETIAVSNIYLRTLGPKIEVLAEVDGKWRVIIDGYEGMSRDGLDLNIGHCVSALGISGSKLDPVLEAVVEEKAVEAKAST